MKYKEVSTNNSLNPPKGFTFVEKSMLGDDDNAKLRGVIIIPDCVADMDDDGDDNFELRLLNLGDNVDDDNALETAGSFIAMFTLLRLSFKEDEDEAASDVSSIAIFCLTKYYTK